MGGECQAVSGKRQAGCSERKAAGGVVVRGERWSGCGGRGVLGEERWAGSGERAVAVGSLTWCAKLFRQQKSDCGSGTESAGNERGVVV